MSGSVFFGASGDEHWDPLDPRSTAWCRTHFAMMAEGGAWGVPRSGLLFRKQAGALILYGVMPYDERMPITAEQLREQQDGEYDGIRQAFEAAGIVVRKDVTVT